MTPPRVGLIGANGHGRWHRRLLAAAPHERADVEERLRTDAQAPYLYVAALDALGIPSLSLGHPPKGQPEGTTAGFAWPKLAAINCWKGGAAPFFLARLPDAERERRRLADRLTRLGLRRWLASGYIRGPPHTY